MPPNTKTLFIREKKYFTYRRTSHDCNKLKRLSPTALTLTAKNYPYLFYIFVQNSKNVRLGQARIV